MFILLLPFLCKYCISPIGTQHSWENYMKLTQENKVYFLLYSMSYPLIFSYELKL